MKSIKLITILFSLFAFASITNAQESPFRSGPVFTGFGDTATIDADIQIPKNQKFKIRFDASKQGENGNLNSSVNSLARFINMHVAAGVKEENIELAIVLHGTATLDMLNNEAYKKRHNGADNPNIEMINALLAKGVKFYQCGQSAAYRGVAKDEFIPGVKIVLSAMTAHILLNDEGYVLNPF